MKPSESRPQPASSLRLCLFAMSPTLSGFFFFFSSRRRHTRLTCDWSSDVCSSDLLVKARRGYGSRHIYRAHSRPQLEQIVTQTPEETMVQALCTGEEFSIDVVCDLEGRCLNAIPRTMIESKGGESIKGMTVKDR